MSLFDDTTFVTPGYVDPADLSAGQRRTLRNKLRLAEGIHPVSGRPLLDAEWGFHCKTCAHLFLHEPGNTRFWKCGLNVTGGPGTDVRVGWPACTRYRIEVR
jgi:hypothetical protein